MDSVKCVSQEVGPSSSTSFAYRPTKNACSDELDIAMTANGLLLKQHVKLHQAGLSRVTISLDALDESIFKSMGDTNADPQVVGRHR